MHTTYVHCMAATSTHKLTVHVFKHSKHRGRILLTATVKARY